MRQYTKRRPERGRRQRGAVLAMVGVAMTMIIGMAVIGVDVGHIAFTANEAQSLADVGATAGGFGLGQYHNTGAGDPESEARSAMLLNQINGGDATNGNIDSFEYGTWNVQNATFTPVAGPQNATAVRVVTSANVDNFFAGIFGNPQSLVTRDAVASLECPTAGRLVLPIAVGECYFDQFQSSGDCSDLPILAQQPPADETSCWTSLTQSNPSAANTISLLPPECCSGNTCGGGQPGPLVSVGDDIGVQNGQVASVLQVIRGCLNANPPLTDFIIPIIDCQGGCTGSREVTGFAEITISAVRATGNNKGMDLTAICKTDSGSGVGGPCNGITNLVLVD